MPPASKRDVAVILFDLKMDRQKSIGILKEIILHNSIRNKHNSFCLILLNTSESKNALHFSHIREVTKEVPYTLDVIPCIEQSEIADADWLEGLELAASTLSNHNGKAGVYTLQLIFITDFKTPLIEIGGVDERMDNVITQLRDNMIFLYVIGLDTESSITIKHKDDVGRYMKTLVFKDAEFQKSKNKELATKIVRQAEGIICPTELAIDFLTFYVNNIPKQGWLAPLTFEGFEFPTITSRIITPEVLVKMKREGLKNITWIAPAKTAGAEDRVLTQDDRVECYYYLDKIIPVPDDVKASFKFQGARMFKLVGFVDAEAIPEIYMEGEEAHSVRVKPTDPKAEAFHHLVESTHRNNKYALALRVYNNNNAPKLYILIPQPPDHFIMVPHCELVKEMCYPLDPKPKSLGENDDLTNKFTDYLSELSTLSRPLHPSCSVGPYYHQYLKNMLNIIDPKSSSCDEVPLETTTTDALKALEEALGGNKDSQGDAEQSKMDDDEEDDW